MTCRWSLSPIGCSTFHSWRLGLLAFGAGGCLFSTDVVETLPGLVGWCLESLFFTDTNTATIFCPARIVNLQTEGPDGQQKRNIGLCKLLTNEKI